MEKIFKAKRLDNGEWVEFWLFGIQWSDHDSVRVKVKTADFDSFVFVSKNTICQFTGLYASNGRIFEGDYIKPSLSREDRDYVVSYCKDDHCLKIGGDAICYEIDWNLNSLTLTGHNIHDKD